MSATTTPPPEPLTAQTAAAALNNRLTPEGAFVFVGYVSQAAIDFPDRSTAEAVRSFMNAFEGQAWVFRPL